VYKIDTDNSVFQITNIPTVFPIGKSYFLIKGSDELQNLSEIEIEIIDAAGKPVFYDIVSTIESTSNIISVWVQNDTEQGNANLIILGKSKDVPTEWFNNYNVKYKTQLYLDKNIPNVNQIKFEFNPTVTATEFIRKYVNYETTKLNDLEFSGGTISGKNISVLSNDNGFDIKTLPYEMSLSSGYELSSSFENPILYINQITGDYRLGNKIYHTTIYNYTSSILNIKNSHTFTVSNPPTSSLGEILNFTNMPNYKIKYENNTTGSSTIYTASYLELDIKNIIPFSGEVKTLRIYKNILNSDITQQHLGDYLIQNYELLSIDNSFERINIGNFKVNNTISNWVTSSKYEVMSIGQIPPIVQLDNNQIFGAVELMNVPIDNTSKFYPNLTISSDANVEYTLNFDCATLLDSRLIDNEWNISIGQYYIGDIVYNYNIPYICYNNHNSTQDGSEPGTGHSWPDYWIDMDPVTSNQLISSIDIYVSGSAVNNTDLNGKKIGSIQCSTIKNYGNLNFNVITDKQGTFKPVFIIKTGKWYIANISFKYSSDLGYNPYSTKIYIPNISNKRNDYSQFDIQFLNSKNEISQTQIQTNVIKIVNNPTYIELDDNVLSGSMFIGAEINSGIEMAGKGSGYVRSIGYNGYTTATQGSTPAGFIIYSGSKNLSTVLSSNDNYEGVGIELNAGANYGRMKFKADYTHSIFEVIADSFYVGSSTTQFISGSGGLIEISSSNFHLSSSGDVIVKGSITADSGYFGGFTISSHSIGSAHLFLSGSPTSIDGYDTTSNMFISTSNFNVKSNGDITGSNVLFSGGKVGGLLINDTSLYNNYLNITSSLQQTIPENLIPTVLFDNVNNFTIVNQGPPSGSGIVTIDGIQYLKLQVADGSNQTPEYAETGIQVEKDVLYNISSNIFISGSDYLNYMALPFPLLITIYENSVLQDTITYEFDNPNYPDNPEWYPINILIHYIAKSSTTATIHLEFGNIQQSLVGIQAYISNFNISYYNPLVEISEKGILIASSPSQYINMNIDYTKFTSLTTDTCYTHDIRGINGWNTHFYIKPVSASSAVAIGYDNGLVVQYTGSNAQVKLTRGKLIFETTDINLYKSGSGILKADSNFECKALKISGSNVPTIIYSSTGSGAISSFNQNITTASGFYRTTIYYGVLALGSGTGTVYSTLTYDNPSGTQHTMTGATLTTSNGIGFYYTYQYNVYHIGTNNINIALTTAGLGAGGTITYALTVERLV